MNILQHAVSIILGTCAGIGFFLAVHIAVVTVTGEGGYYTVKMGDWEYSAGTKSDETETPN